MSNGKVRIYELSKELNLENKDILEVCENLNISVKSHSSTIESSDADRIRVQVEKHPEKLASHSSFSASGKTTSLGTESGSPTPPVKKQLQIREIRPNSKQMSANGSQDHSGQTETTKPRAPNRKAQNLSQSAGNRAAVGEKVEPPKPPAKEPEKPRAQASVPEAVKEKGLQNPEGPRSKSGTEPLEAKKSELIGPPVKREVKTEKPSWGSRNQQGPVKVKGGGKPDKNNEENSKQKDRKKEKPSKGIAPEIVNIKHADAASAPEKQSEKGSKSLAANKPILKRSKTKEKGSESPVKQPRGGNQRSQELVKEKPVGVKKPVISAGSSKSGSAEVDGGTHVRGGTEQVLELRRPRPIRPVAAPTIEKKDSSEVDQIDLEKESEDKDQIDWDLKRPVPRPTKRLKKREETEEEEKISQKAGKGVAKNKRRAVLIDEDEDDFDEDEDDLAIPVEVNLSLVRPAKPKGSSAPQGKVAPKAAPPRQKGKQEDQKQKTAASNSREPSKEKPSFIELKDGLTVRDMASLLVVPETEIVKQLFYKGIAATVTQTLDVPTASLVAEVLGVEVKMASAESEARKITEMLDESDLEKLQRRPPVVTIMGHVDHGKTTLLDSIRKTKVAQGEAGGITQHIGAYHVDVEHAGEKAQIVFLDTPGHEAFTAMRARGARVTDIAILVVAADDGVRPQTIEAISHALAAEVPLVVAINKIDKEGAQPDRVKQELMDRGLVPEEWGGDTIMVPVSAIKGENLDTLLEMILLVAEIEELSANPDRVAKGTVIEAHLDKAKGSVASLLVQNGTLNVGDTLLAGAALGKVRAMIDDRGNRVETAGPSCAVEVLGLGDVPSAGDEFEVFEDEKEAKAIASARILEQRESRLQQAMASRRVTLNSLSARAQEGDLKELNLVLKADVQGSLEAILGSLKQLPQNEVQVRVLLAAPGEIAETDVDLAAASSAVIVGFNTTFASGARSAADEAGVDVREYDVIYSMLDDIHGAMEGLLDPEMVEEELGKVEVRAVFPVGKGAVAGCYVLSGKAVRNCNLRVRRGKNVIHEGILDSLKRMKDDVKDVSAGFECGIGVEKFNDWAENDIIETYRMVTKRRTLSPS